MTNRITIEQAMRFGIKHGFKLFPEEDSAGLTLDLESLTYSLLIEKGYLTGDYWLKDLENHEVVRDGICLAYNGDAVPDLCDYVPPENIELILTQAHLAEYISAPLPTLRLISKRSLFKLLPKYINITKEQGLSGPDMPKISDVAARASVRDLLNENPDYSGRVYVCDYKGNSDMPCNEPVCHSEFAWSKEGNVLFYMSVSCDLITGAWLLPSIRTLQ